MRLSAARIAATLAVAGVTSPAFAQEQNSLTGVRTINVLIRTDTHSDNKKQYFDRLSLKEDVESWLKEAGIKITNAEDHEHTLSLLFSFLEQRERPGRLFYYASARFYRNGAVDARPDQTERSQRYLPVPMQIWSSSSTGTVGSEKVVKGVWDKSREFVGEFLAEHAKANAGYRGPDVTSVREHPTATFEGVRAVGVTVEDDPKSPQGVTQAWVMAALESRLQGTDVSAMKVGVDRLEVSIQMMSAGFQSVALVRVEFYRPAIVQLPTQATVVIGRVWRSRSFMIGGMLTTETWVRQDILESLTNFANEIKAAPRH